MIMTVSVWHPCRLFGLGLCDTIEANSVYTWAHLGKAANAPKPRRRSEHVQQLAREFANGVATLFGQRYVVP